MYNDTLWKFYAVAYLLWVTLGILILVALLALVLNILVPFFSSKGKGKSDGYS